MEKEITQKTALWEQISNKYGESIIPMYKAEAPFMENDNGIGFKGVVLLDIANDKIQCNECGKWYEFICFSHLRKHGITIHEYKEKYGIGKMTPLVNQALHKKQVAYGVERYNKNLKPILGKTKKEIFETRSRLGKLGPKKHKLTMQKKNLFGTCDAQLRERFEVLYKQIGHIPTKKECSFYGTLVDRFGSYRAAVSNFGYTFISRGGNQFDLVFTRDILFKMLLEFKENNKREPMCSDLREYGGSMPVSISPFRREFGGFIKAKKEIFK